MSFSCIFAYRFLIHYRFFPCNQIGEFVSDYVEVRRDYTDWTPLYEKPKPSIHEVLSTAGDRHGLPDADAIPNGYSKHLNGSALNSHAADSDQLPSISEKIEERST